MIEAELSKKCTLGSWQRKQAAMLYFYSSLEYLTRLQKMVSKMIDNIIDPSIELAVKERRDDRLASKKLGRRDTVENWSNNAWPFLKDLQISLLHDVIARSNGEYSTTSVMDRLRGMGEYSTVWATSAEEEKFATALANISAYSLPHDQTLEDSYNAWDDFSLTKQFQEFAADRVVIPKFRIRRDITASTGQLPPKTGVYIATDDPNATLQFVWNSGRGAQLRPANTFNDIGLAALIEVGRDDLWLNDQKMFAFAMNGKNAETFRSNLTYGGSEWTKAASGTVAMSAFQTTPSTWAFVEICPGETESIVSNCRSVAAHDEGTQRIEGGSKCIHAGYYFTPSIEHSRRFFKMGERTPDIRSSYGKVFWQWDDSQENVSS